MSAARMISQLYLECMETPLRDKSRVGVSVRGKTFFGQLGKIAGGGNFFRLIGGIYEGRDLYIMLDSVDYAYLSPVK